MMLPTASIMMIGDIEAKMEIWMISSGLQTFQRQQKLMDQKTASYKHITVAQSLNSSILLYKLKKIKLSTREQVE